VNAVSVREARALLDVASAIAYDARAGAFAPEGLTALLELLEADWVTYSEGPIGAARLPLPLPVKSEVETRPFAGHTAELEATFNRLFPEYTLGCRPAPACGVVLIGDVTTDRAWHRTAVYNEWCRVVHIEPQAKISLTVPGSAIGRGLMFDLADDVRRTFGERERTILTLIRPSLMRPIVWAEKIRVRHRALGLTARELEVLDLVRSGMTNGEIAGTLVVSPATIRSHLEHAFAKLGAHTRTEAIARLGELQR
jgi:DNA-binding CsgD family transcriptional regulator